MGVNKEHDSNNPATSQERRDPNKPLLVKVIERLSEEPSRYIQPWTIVKRKPGIFSKPVEMVDVGEQVVGADAMKDVSKTIWAEYDIDGGKVILSREGMELLKDQALFEDLKLHMADPAGRGKFLGRGQGSAEVFELHNHPTIAIKEVRESLGDERERFSRMELLRFLTKYLPEGQLQVPKHYGVIYSKDLDRWFMIMERFDGIRLGVGRNQPNPKYRTLFGLDNLFNYHDTQQIQSLVHEVVRHVDEVIDEHVVQKMPYKNGILTTEGRGGDANYFIPRSFHDGRDRDREGYYFKLKPTAVKRSGLYYAVGDYEPKQKSEWPKPPPVIIIDQ